MNVHFSPEVRQSPEWPLVAAASELLPRIGSPEAIADVEAEWTRVESPAGRPAYRLSLKDALGKVSKDYTPFELGVPQHMKFNMYLTWGDLLKIRSDIQYERVRASARDYFSDGGE